MTRRFLLSVAVSLLLLGLLAGCANRCRQPFTATCPNRCSPCAPSAGVPGVPPPPSAIPAGPAPVGVVAPAPPPDAGVPPAPGPTPGGSPLYPSGTPGASLSPSAPTPANPTTPDTRFSSPAPLADQWQPSQAGVRLSGPESGAQAGAQEQRDNVRLQPPATPEPPTASAKPAVVEQRIPPAASPSLPVGIPEFAVIVPEKVTAGQKPALEAFDWLKSNNYRTVVHLLKPSEPDGARAEVERRGLKYLTIEVSDTRLAKAVEDFNRAVNAAENQPVFVYDRDGSLAGPLWYLRFRTADRLPEEEARRKATSLGLRDDGTGDSINLWVAIQEYLRKNK